jgi:hypothetical protein
VQKRRELHTCEALGPVYCRLPLLNDLFCNIGYTFRLCGPQLAHRQSSLAFLQVAWIGQRRERKKDEIEILTLKIPSVTFFSFNKARTLRVSYIQSEQSANESDGVYT